MCGDLLFPAGVDPGGSVGCGGDITDGAVGITGVAGVSVVQGGPYLLAGVTLKFVHGVDGNEVLVY